MGLGLSLKGVLNGRGDVQRGADAESFYSAIRGAIPQFFQDELERQLISGGAWGETSHLYLHPAEEPVEFHYAGDGSLDVSAKTSSAGPGYHARVVEFLDFLGSRLGVDMEWRDGEEEAADETGYHEHRDFERLQLDMAELLQAIARQILGEEDAANFCLSLPLEMSPRTNHYAASPLGFWSREWFERISSCDGQEALALAAEYFPWWSEERDSRFWLNCGSVLCWVDLPWHRPSDEQEIKQYRRALQCFSRARTLDPGMTLPEREIAEIEEILKDGDWDRVPQREGMGFRRHALRCDLTGNWTVELPGYFHQGSEEDGKTLVYWFGGRTLRGSSISFRGGDPGDLEQRDQDLLESIKQDMGGQGDLFEIRNGHVAGWASESRTEEDDETYWSLQGQIVFGNSLCFVTIAYDDPEADRAWALEVMRSVTCPNP